MGIYDAAKDAANVLKEAGKIKEYQQILELMQDLLDKQKKIDELERESKVLKEKLKNKDDLIFKNNAYYKKENNDGPFCSRCWDKDNILIRIIPTSLGGNYAKCPECKNSFNYTGREVNQSHNTGGISWR